MSFSNYGRLRPQVRFLQRQFLQDSKLPFTDVLSEQTIEQALKALNFVWLDRVYTPLVTLWVGQTTSRDQSRFVDGCCTGVLPWETCSNLLQQLRNKLFPKLQ